MLSHVFSCVHLCSALSPAIVIGTSVMLFSATGCVVRHENNQR